MKSEPAAVVKYRSVTIPVRSYTTRDGRTVWRYRSADGRRVNRASLDAAKADALAEATSLHRGLLDLTTLTGDQSRAIRRMLDADPSCGLIDEFLGWIQKRKPRKTVGEAIEEFLALKESNRGPSKENVRTLRSAMNSLEPIAARQIADIGVAGLPAIAGSSRTRANVRAAWVTFFRWCVRQQYLPEGTTAPERIERPITRRKTPTTYSAGELRILLANVRPEYAPWLICAAFAGVRAAEVCPPPGSEKSPLDWSDFQWDRGIFIVRAETAKTGHRRVVPITPALERWLRPLAKPSGRVCEALRPPSSGQGDRGLKKDGTPRKKAQEAETTRLGQFIGGWKNNALRHSWVSCRAATPGIGISQTAMEAGNSESEARKSYVDAMGADDADAWFSV